MLTRHIIIIVINFYERCLYIQKYCYMQGPAVAIARGCGQCLNFNPMFVITFMFRRVLSWIRSTKVSFLFPLDQSIRFHKLVGWTILVFASIHTVSHIINFGKLAFMF